MHGLERVKALNCRRPLGALPARALLSGISDGVIFALPAHDDRCGSGMLASSNRSSLPPQSLTASHAGRGCQTAAAARTPARVAVSPKQRLRLLPDNPAGVTAEQRRQRRHGALAEVWTASIVRALSRLGFVSVVAVGLPPQRRHERLNRRHSRCWTVAGPVAPGPLLFSISWTSYPRAALDCF